MKFGVLQLDTGAHRGGEKHAEITHALAGCSGDLVVLPERVNFGSPQFRPREEHDFAEPVPGGPTTALLSRLARQTHSHFVAGISELEDGVLCNSAVLVGPAGYIGRHRKIVPPETEQGRYRYGQAAEVFDLGFAKAALLICADLESDQLLRNLKDRGVNLICHCNEFHGPAMPALVRQRAAEFGVTIVSANRCGFMLPDGKGLRYEGRSSVVDSSGKVRLKAGNEAGLQTVDWPFPT